MVYIENTMWAGGWYICIIPDFNLKTGWSLIKLW